MRHENEFIHCILELNFSSSPLVFELDLYSFLQHDFASAERHDAEWWRW